MIFLTVVDIALWSGGLGLFLVSLAVMVRVKVRREGLVTSGPYKYVRHPQHLGISLVFLGVSFIHILVPFKYYPYFRPGDIIAWLFTTFLLITRTDIEEVRLTREFGEEYEEYPSKTPFILPFLRLPIRAESKHLKQGRPLRYIMWFVIFWILARGILYLSTFTILYWTR